MADTFDVPRCPARSLSGRQCARHAGHSMGADGRDHDFGSEDTSPVVVPDALIDAINWSLARDCARMSAEIGILHHRIVELEHRLEAFRKHRSTTEGIVPPIVVR